MRPHRPQPNSPASSAGPRLAAPGVVPPPLATFASRMRRRAPRQVGPERNGPHPTALLLQLASLGTKLLFRRLRARVLAATDWVRPRDEYHPLVAGRCLTQTLATSVSVPVPAAISADRALAAPRRLDPPYTDFTERHITAAPESRRRETQANERQEHGPEAVRGLPRYRALVHGKRPTKAIPPVRLTFAAFAERSRGGAGRRGNRPMVSPCLHAPERPRASQRPRHVQGQSRRAAGLRKAIRWLPCVADQEHTGRQKNLGTTAARARIGSGRTPEPSPVASTIVTHSRRMSASCTAMVTRGLNRTQKRSAHFSARPSRATLSAGRCRLAVRERAGRATGPRPSGPISSPSGLPRDGTEPTVRYRPCMSVFVMSAASTRTVRSSLCHFSFCGAWIWRCTIPTRI